MEGCLLYQKAVALNMMSNDDHTILSRKRFSLWLLLSFFLCSGGTFSGYLANSYSFSQNRVSTELVVSLITASHCTISISPPVIFLAEDSSPPSEYSSRLAEIHLTRLVQVQLYSSSKKLLEIPIVSMLHLRRISLPVFEKDPPHLFLV